VAKGTATTRAARLGSLFFARKTTCNMRLQVHGGDSSNDVKSIECHTWVMEAAGGPVIADAMSEKSLPAKKGEWLVVDFPDVRDYAIAEKVVAFIYDQPFDATSEELIKLIEAAKRLQLEDPFLELSAGHVWGGGWVGGWVLTMARRCYKSSRNI